MAAVNEVEARLLVALLRAVGRLALPADDQLAYLRATGMSDLADELALDLDDGAGIAPTLLESGCLKPAEVELINRIDTVLSQMSGSSEPELWRERGLRSDSRWAEVRRLARQFLYMQG